IAEYQKLVDAKPRDPLAAKAQYGIGDALFNAGRTDEAVAAYQVVLDRYAGSAFVPDAAAGIQYALASTGQAARAQRMIEEYAAQHPGSPILDELRFRQAEVQYQGGDVQGALAARPHFVRSLEAHRPLAHTHVHL